MKSGVVRWFPLPGWGIQGQGDGWMSDQSHYAMLFMILLGVVGTYVSFQLKLLPKEVARVVAKVYFWPTVPFSIAIREWITPIDDVVLLGVAPLSILGLPECLQAAGVKGVVNMCDEFEGPVKEYNRRGIKQLRLRTVDHVQPSVGNLIKGVKWINEYKKKGEKVYVHCKAGHGRSSALVMAWLMAQEKGSPEELQVECSQAGKWSTVRDCLDIDDVIDSIPYSAQCMSLKTWRF